MKKSLFAISMCSLISTIGVGSLNMASSQSATASNENTEVKFINSHNETISILSKINEYDEINEDKIKEYLVSWTKNDNYLNEFPLNLRYTFEDEYEEEEQFQYETLDDIEMCIAYFDLAGKAVSNIATYSTNVDTNTISVLRNGLDFLMANRELIINIVDAIEESDVESASENVYYFFAKFNSSINKFYESDEDCLNSFYETLHTSLQNETILVNSRKDVSVDPVSFLRTFNEKVTSVFNLSSDINTNNFLDDLFNDKNCYESPYVARMKEDVFNRLTDDDLDAIKNESFEYFDEEVDWSSLTRQEKINKINEGNSVYYHIFNYLFNNRDKDNAAKDILSLTLKCIDSVLISLRYTFKYLDKTGDMLKTIVNESGPLLYKLLDLFDAVEAEDIENTIYLSSDIAEDIGTFYFSFLVDDPDEFLLSESYKKGYAITKLFYKTEELWHKGQYNEGILHVLNYMTFLIELNDVANVESKVKEHLSFLANFKGREVYSGEGCPIPNFGNFNDIYIDEAHEFNLYIRESNAWVLYKSLEPFYFDDNVARVELIDANEAVSTYLITLVNGDSYKVTLRTNPDNNNENNWWINVQTLTNDNSKMNLILLIVSGFALLLSMASLIIMIKRRK